MRWPSFPLPPCWQCTGLGWAGRAAMQGSLQGGQQSGEKSALGGRGAAALGLTLPHVGVRVLPQPVERAAQWPCKAQDAQPWVPSAYPDFFFLRVRVFFLITGNSYDKIYHFQMNALLVFSIFTVLVQPSPWSNSRMLPSPQQDTPYFLISPLPALGRRCFTFCFCGSACFVCLFVYKFILFLFLAALGLCCCVQAFSSCGERGLLFVVVRGLLIAVASLVAEHRL